ncbi:hypothetical protein Tco_0754417, partial [Tanacetum coccineum]
VIEFCSTGYKDAPGSVSSFLSSFCISVGTSGLNDLELKLTVSKYERQQLIEEAASLKDKMLKTLNLENEVCYYKRKLDKLKSEKSNLEASLRSISSSFEELQAENILFAKEMPEYRNCKNKKSALEEKLMRLESDLMDGTRLQELLTPLGNPHFPSLEMESQKTVMGQTGTPKGRPTALKSRGANETRSQEDIDYAAKIEMLEAELDEAIDANKKYILHEVNCWLAESVHGEDGMNLFIRTKKCNLSLDGSMYTCVLIV